MSISATTTNHERPDMEQLLPEVLKKFDAGSSGATSPGLLMGLHRQWFWHSTWVSIAASGKRSIDLLLSLTLVLLLSPLFMLLYLYIYVRGSNSILDTFEYLDRDGQRFPVMQFSKSPANGARSGKLLAILHLDELPKLFDIMVGRLSFVGPTPVLYSKNQDTPAYVHRRLRPGLTNPYILKQAVNLAHQNKELAEREYICQQSLSGDLGILLRSIPARLLSRKEVAADKPPSECVTILDIKIHNHNMEQAVEHIFSIASHGRSEQVAFVNQDCLNISVGNTKYRELLQSIPLVLADGIGIHIACRMLNTAMADNVNGTDLFPFLCERAEQRKIPIYFLGGRDGIAERMVGNLKETWPELRIAGFHHGYFDESDEAALIEEIASSGAGILLTAFGAPRQELWLQRHQQNLGVGVCIGVGGLFDFYSGNIKRAPVWMREIGMEWVYRLLQEPGRMWRRYIIGIPLFIWRIWRWRQK
jgi:N-acetylglucosaminyldiphosphoundecaprenol N-acetyl-beta-D-mannosaminyltransferase